jgi:hypothetical protein
MSGHRVVGRTHKHGMTYGRIDYESYRGDSSEDETRCTKFPSDPKTAQEASPHANTLVRRGAGHDMAVACGFDCVDEGSSHPRTTQPSPITRAVVSAELDPASFTIKTCRNFFHWSTA